MEAAAEKKRKGRPQPQRSESGGRSRKEEKAEAAAGKERKWRPQPERRESGGRSRKEEKGEAAAGKKRKGRPQPQRRESGGRSRKEEKAEAAVDKTQRARRESGLKVEAAVDKTQRARRENGGLSGLDQDDRGQEEPTAVASVWPGCMVTKPTGPADKATLTCTPSEPTGFHPLYTLLLAAAGRAQALSVVSLVLCQARWSSVALRPQKP